MPLGMSIIDIFTPLFDTDIAAETYWFSMSMWYILNHEKIKDLSFLAVELLNFLVVVQSSRHSPLTFNNKRILEFVNIYNIV
jgi:hypothetical protein